ncbi:hypothetical protein V499_04838 [Pseudogymnoascus sp. VKM F-103]|uniref:Cell wall mannoprotein PIR1-like C-terminal domain-containing protein n=1 Tax=Pseudogymnoascus verrucosus TaxID=342668 RepID=A0A2P2SVY7_9PEZI|nr:uncharacterized protein VE01_00994 [Pseudogymnoascus verrucosus]KFY75184.1 hypothetical protein V499_04838 [Pseudogymnoascus sp. VKM F-103]OBU00994.1 hypothetical protein VE01_00994 [Pseudogymnoascus verrucosus]
MRYTFAAAALAAATLTTSVNGSAMPQAGSSGCQPSFEGSFQIKVVSGSTPATPRMMKRAQCGSSGSLVATLKDGVLTDAQGRIGSIVSNHQFQFDPAPGQVNAITTSGFSVCNNKLGLRGSTNFFQCRSGNFFNLYDESIAPQCEPITIDIISCASGGDPPGDPPVSQVGDGQPQSGAGQQLGDGQVQNPAVAQQGGAAGEAGEGQIQSPGAQQGGAAGEAGEGQIQSPGAQQGGSGTQPGAPSGGTSGTQPGAGSGSGGGASPSGGGASGGAPTCASCAGGSQPSGSGAGGGGGGASGGQQPAGNNAGGGGASGGGQPSGSGTGGGAAQQINDGQLQSGGGGGGASNEAVEGQIQSPARF